MYLLDSEGWNSTPITDAIRNQAKSKLNEFAILRGPLLLESPDDGLRLLAYAASDTTMKKPAVKGKSQTW